jgi:oligopeptidase A
MRFLAAITVATAVLAAENPLLTTAANPPGTPIPFDQVKPEHVSPAIDQLLKQAEKQRADFKASSGPRTWANTMEPLEALGQELEAGFKVVQVLESVASTPAMRKEFNAAIPKVQGFFSSLGLDADLAKKVKDYAETAEAKALTGPKARLLSVTLDEFRRAGAFLDDAKRKRLGEINVELSSLSAKFGQNVLDSTNAYELMITDEKKLAGLPESARQAAAASAKSKGKEGWRFTLQAPSRLAVLQFLDDGKIREEIYKASFVVGTQAPNDNRPIMARELELRREKASLLGYKSFADYQTENRMAKSGDRVIKFLNDLDEKARPSFEKENVELQAFRKSIEGPNAPPLQPWDVTYYAEKMRKQLYDFDEESVRPYLPIDQVFQGMFQLVNRLYGIQVKPVANSAVWHADVKFYEIRDNENRLLGSFYSDWHPREGKRPGAWMNPLSYGGPVNGKNYPHLGMIVGNVTGPVAGKPALVTQREVETIFHEFGHLLHLALSNAPIRSLSGTQVAWDFVELPSQIMENFTWERPVMDLYAKHYEKGEKLPDDLFEKMKKAKTFRSANQVMRSAGFGMMDMMLHTEYTGDDKQGDVLTYGRRILNRYSPVPLPDYYAMPAQFSHIFAGGYAAGYYSYQWSEVLDADAFTRFKQGGVFSSEIGSQFRRAVLEKGNTEPAEKLFRDFMGRDPDVKALLERSGLDFKQNMK